MKKETSEMVWPVENYTDKIHTALKVMFQLRPWLTYTIEQMKAHVVRGYPWLANPSERQTVLLNKIIKTGIQKLVQGGLVKKVTSKTATESQWQSARGVDESHINITSEESVAQTPEAVKAIGRRALGGRSLWRLNTTPKLSVCH